MAKKKNINPILFAFLIPLLVVAGLLVLLLSGRGPGNTGRPMQTIQHYTGDGFNRWKGQDGNKFSLRCEIADQLGYVDGKGRLLSIRPVENGQTQGRLVVFVPASLDSTLSFEKGQKYDLSVRFDKDRLIVTKAEKP